MEQPALSLGLIGYPLLQSLSPRLHTAGLHSLGRPGEYRLYPIPPLPEGAGLMAETLARLRGGQIQGLNVTIPHKQAVLPYLDRLTRRAQAIGAVNTIYCCAGLLTGDNTDAPGFLSDLQRILADQGGVEATSGCCALALGAGGAARAVAYALWQAGWQTTVAARRPDQATALVASLTRQYENFVNQPPAQTSEALKTSEVFSDGLSAIALESASLETALCCSDSPVNIIVNASSAGMIPDTAACPWPVELMFPAGWLVYDLVYKPPETELLRRARAAGLAGYNGLGMLVEQAALALEIWSGQPAPRQALWQALNL